MDFVIDRRPVTVGEFAGFAEETGYTTIAERPPKAGDYPDADPTLSRSCQEPPVRLPRPRNPGSVAECECRAGEFSFGPTNYKSGSGLFVAA